jgi:hypothetical protein
MKKKFAIITLTITFILGIQVSTVKSQTYCNPLNLSYQFSSDKDASHGIANPTILLYKDNYFLFASNVNGYWYSGDLISWKLATDTNLPAKNIAPTAAVIGDWIYYFKSSCDTIFRSNDPISGKWEVYGKSILFPLISDFAIFLDTDGRVYCYYGCTNNDGVMSRELDPNNLLKPIGVPVVCRLINSFKKAGKKPKSNSDKAISTYAKGSWMNKYNGKYYYQCAERNIGSNNYSDVVYVSDTPTGPFKFAANNPFSFRPDGFICGAGNGATFTDKYGNWWHVATVSDPVNHETQSRLGLFPAGFDKDGNLFTKTDFGDYPITMPDHKYTNINKLNPEWALLSDNIKAESSSNIGSCPISSAFDEDIATYWSAQTGLKGEWLSVDLGSVCTINAFQLNFARNKSQIVHVDTIHAYQYLVQYSIDKKDWKTLSDKTSNTEYQTNPYEPLSIPVQAQYVKITNQYVPEGTFAISGFRLFGSGSDRKPKKVSLFRIVRDYRNPQIIKLFWDKQENTAGYNIRYGTDKDKLYHSYQVFKKNRATIICPDKSKAYWFEIDAFNENGVTSGKPQLSN